MKSNYEAKIEFCDVDLLQNLRLISLFSHLMRASDIDVTKRGIGIDYLHETWNATWVLMRMGMEVRRMPRYGEMMRIETWMGERMRQFCTRYYIMYVWNCGWHEVGRVSSVWTIIDRVTRSICQGIFSDEEFWNGKLEDESVEVQRVRCKCEGECFSYRYRVRYSDLDQNGHLHSGRYISLMLDTSHKMAGRMPMAFEIKFSNEVKLGEEVTVRAVEGNDSVEYIIENLDGKRACTGIIQIKNDLSYNTLSKSLNA